MHHTKRSLEAIVAISAAGILVSGELTFIEVSNSAGTLFGLPLGLYDLLGFGAVFLIAIVALWRRSRDITIP